MPNIPNINNVMQNNASENQARVGADDGTEVGEITEIFVNRELLQQGYATIFEVEPDVKKCEEIEE